MKPGNPAAAGFLQSLRSVHGIGEQTASMTALFWLGRPAPILDTYLLNLLQRHGLLSTSFSSSAIGKRELAHHLVNGARDIEARRADWPPERVLSCLYLWACEVGRLHCRCESTVSPDCPIVRGYGDAGR